MDKCTDLLGNDFPEDVLSLALGKIEDYVKRPLRSGSYSEVISGGGVNRIFLTVTPVTDVNEVIVNGKVFSGTSFKFLRDTGQVSFKNGGVFTFGTENVIVKYNGGNHELPDDVISAALEVARQIQDKATTDKSTLSTAASKVSIYEPTAKMILNKHVSLTAGTTACL